VAAALSSLKGPKHGGANIKVIEMMDDLKANVSDITDREQVRTYLQRLVDKKAFDGKGLIYGMGHAIYSISDPRAKVFKGYVKQLAKEKNLEQDYALYEMVEEMAPAIISGKRKTLKDISANVDFFSGFVYRMLGIPEELYTPIFAMARIVGWSAHRLEELVNANKIIRPAYDSVGDERSYIAMDER
jgi:citrate synthase